MVNPRNIITCLILSLAALAASALDTSTAILNPDFRTLRTELEGAFLLPPVARLGTSDRIIISFDEIGDDYSRLRYRLIHCNADWQPSRLLESEYLKGFNEAEIEDFAFSSNTYVHYVNYRIAIPSDDMQPIVSGNYLMQVFEADDPDDIILQTRFSLSEGAVAVGGTASGRTDKGFNTSFQQVDFAIDASGFNIGNPYQDLAITVTQNNSPDTERTVCHPIRVAGKEIVFEHNPDLVFDASNEFRRFETVRVDYPGMRVDSVTWGGTNWHAWLAEDFPRGDSDYVYDSTQRGRFMIDEFNATDPDLGADYVTVHFTLDAPEIIDGDIYLDGDLTLHSRDSRYKMQYDRSRGLYTLQLPLKQGSYNYQYVAVPKGKKGKGTSSPVEGDKFETINEYLVKVFHRPPGSRGDRLIGASTILSTP